MLPLTEEQEAQICLRCPLAGCEPESYHCGVRLARSQAGRRRAKEQKNGDVARQLEQQAIEIDLELWRERQALRPAYLRDWEEEFWLVWDKAHFAAEFWKVWDAEIDGRTKNSKRVRARREWGKAA